MSCWACGQSAPQLIRRGNLPADLSAAHFRITDSNYGSTADLYRCDRCGFQQTSTLHGVLRFYEEMADDEYEATRAARLLQARMLLRTVAAHRPTGRLLDVGAGSGILVEEALSAGYRAEGIEPSRPLFEQGLARRLPLHHGTLPSPEASGPYDVTTVIDVIEHVEDPVGLMTRVAGTLTADGLVVVVTPDASSLAARLLGSRWWHYRIAHIGYFNRTNLTIALRRAGLEVTHTSRPAWYFPVSYLAERAMKFLPAALRFRPPAFLGRFTMPLNLFDSLLVIARKAANAAP